MTEAPRRRNVRGVSFHRLEKRLNIGNQRTVSVPRFACVTKGDAIVLRRGPRLTLDVHCQNGLARVLPVFTRSEEAQLGTRSIRIRIKEVTDSQELDGYLNLASFHYRNEQLAGRRVPLVAVSELPYGPKVLGYIELATSFFMNKPRQRVLDSPFSVPAHGISWARWDVTAARKFTNLTVRIARCVIHPEYRGIGLGALLTRNAIRFASSRWQVGGLKPYFIEITADMLKFVPFVRSGGMTYVGETEGNLERVAKDMDYLLTNIDRVNSREILPRGGGGIVAVQKRYVQQAAAIMKAKKISRSDFANRLSAIASSLTPGEYFALYGVLRLPKPTYMAGLTAQASRFLRQRVADLGIEPPRSAQLARIEPLRRSIRVESLTATTTTSVDLTRKTMRVQESFGIRPDHLKSLIFSNLNLQIDPGSIVLFYGPSGSGKTTLLRILAGQADSIRGIQVTGKLRMPRDALIGTFGPLPSKKPLVELFGGDDTAKSIYSLNTAGLSEANLYLRRFDELSNGQRYRAMLASVIDSGANVWIADEFLSTLDPVTASVVAKNIRTHAKRTGVTLLAGAPHYEFFLDSLEPDLVVHMYAPWEYKILEGQELRKAFAQTRA